MMTTLDKIKVTYAIIFLVIGLVLGFIVGKVIGPSSEVTSEGAIEPIKIGFVGPLTGENANIGIPIRRGVELALEDINSAGGINGRQLVAIFEDGKCNAKDANTAGLKLIDQDKVIAIVGGTCSSETLAIAPNAESKKIPLISPSATNPKITDAGDYIFRAATTASDETP
ncbi:MAG: ABC transporter substrate-binding protein, partial [Nanoarchaeota archaeon]